MFQISNTSYRFRKRKLNSKTSDLNSFTTETRADSTPSYLKSFKSAQNSSLSISIPKNIKILPKLQKTFLFNSNPIRYPQTPSNESLRLTNDILIEDQQQRKKNILFRSEKNNLRQKLILTKPLTDINIQLNPNSPTHMQSRYFVLNKQGKRPYNQDRYVCKNGIHKFYFKNHLKKQNDIEQLIDFYGVFDGHGGSGCAQFLKQNFIQFLVRSKNLDSNPQDSLKEAFTISQQKFLSLCESKKFTTQTSGACAVSCIVTQNKIIVGNVGDCRALMFNKEFLCQMTKDHKPTQMGEKMRILKCGGKVYKEQVKMNQFPGGPMKFLTCTRIAPGNLNVSRTIGDIETKLKKYGGLPGMISAQPDIKTFERENYEILLLASDGLFEAFTNAEVQKFYYNIAQSQMKNNLNSNQLARIFLDRLLQQAEKKSTDNITVIVVPLMPYKSTS